jgi:MoaA/NifB/PqqE/SkfB family radical SAM enzyme
MPHILTLLSSPLLGLIRYSTPIPYLIEYDSQSNALSQPIFRKPCKPNTRQFISAHSPIISGETFKEMTTRDSTRLLGSLVSMLKSRFLTHQPFFLAHAITYGCNSRCKTCSFWQTSRMMRDDLSTEGVYHLLGEAYDFGMRAYYLFGGEPMIRRDIEDVVGHAKNLGYTTVMNTNGSLVKNKRDSLWEDLDFAFISLDYFNEYHDFIRGRRGAFREVIDGIKQIKKVGRTRVTLVTTISKLNFDAIEPMAMLAQELGVGISYNAVEVANQFYDSLGLTFQQGFEEGSSSSLVEDYGLSREQLQTFYDAILKLKRDGYPLMETEYALRHYAEGKPFTCHFPKIFVYVSPNNKIYSCTCDHTYDLNSGSFREYFSSPFYRKHVKKSEGCNLCVRTCVRMYSYAYTLKPLNLIDLRKDIRLLMSQK